MKILLVGDADPYGKIPTFVRAFRKLGHETDVVNVGDHYSLTLPNRMLNWIIKVPRYYGVRKLNNEIKKRTLSCKPNFVFFLKPIYVTSQTIVVIKKGGAAVFSFSADPVFFLRNISRSFLKTLPFYDCLFTPNSLEVNELLKLGARKAVFLPPAVDTELMYPVSPSVEDKKRLGADVVFIGTYVAGEKREKYLEKLCREGYDVKVYGNRWERCLKCHCLKKNKRLMYKAYYGEDFSRVVNASKIALVFSREHNKNVMASKTYEIPACGAFMFHEYSKEAAQVFREGEEAEFFRSFDELKKKIDYYLTHPEERDRIAKAGYERVQKQDCNFVARANKILEIYKNL